MYDLRFKTLLYELYIIKYLTVVLTKLSYI